MSPDRPVSAVLRDIARNLEDIVRAELRLAKKEITHEAGKATAGILMIVAGAMMLGIAGIFLLLAIVYGLSLVMPAWAAALIVAGGEAIMAAVFVGIGIRRIKATRAVPRTRATLQENVEWAKHQAT